MKKPMKEFVYFTLDLIAVIRFVCLTVFLSYPVLIYLPQLTGIGFVPVAWSFSRRLPFREYYLLREQ